MDNIHDILAENARRQALLATPYDQIHGTGCAGDRVPEPTSPYNEGHSMVPRAMTADPAYAGVDSRAAYVRLRCRYDFEYWAATVVVIKDKLTGRDVPLMLNAPQRRVTALLEGDRAAGRPLRLIMLKARQWGGSTLVQMYMAWIQCCLCRNHHSLICAHVKDTSAGIRGMYSKMLDAYPPEYWDGDTTPAFRPYERTINVREIAGRGCRVTIGSSENQEAVRGADYAMAHLSEVAFWGDSSRRRPDDLVRAVCGAIALAPLTLIAMESTANGVGNYFHREWLRCDSGRGDKHAVFVPWYEIDLNRLPVDDPAELWRSMDAYEHRLWTMGLTLEQIAWYHAKRREYASHSAMQAEYPTDPVEAFTNTGHNVFASAHIAALQAGCRDPEATGEVVADGRTGQAALRHVRFVSDSLGLLRIWRHPQPGRRYVAAVDIGGRSQRSDYSVIVVLDATDSTMPEVVAQWRGHVDHDILAWKAASIGIYYNKALLAYESNTLECENTDGDPGSYILEQVAVDYPRLYYRHSPVDGVSSYRPGFHTNRSTKSMLVSNLIATLRDGTYIERDAGACAEYAVYEQRPDGSFGARPGNHDDMLMARAIALYAASSGQ